MHVTLDRLGWKSASGHADMTLPAGAKLPLGTLDIRMTRLADLSRIAGQAISGSLKAVIETSQPPGQPPSQPHPVARVDNRGIARRQGGACRAVDPAWHGSRSGRQPGHRPRPSAPAGIAASGITGNARMTAKGPQTALGVALGGTFEHVAGAPASIDTALVLDLPGKHVQVTRLAATAKGESLRLLAPARIGFGAPMEVDHLRASLAAAGGTGAPSILDIAGRLSPRLDLTASLTNVTPALAKPFVPSLDATGVIAAQAHLTGTTARPDGTVSLTARNLHQRTGPGASLPPGTLDARAGDRGRRCPDRGNARCRPADRTGRRRQPRRSVPAARSHCAHAATSTLAVANAVLGAEGRQAGGQLSLDMGVAGTVQAPRLDGTIRLEHGQIQDFAQGVRLTDIEALIAARGQSIGIDRFVAHAGDGTLEASGTVGALLPGLAGGPCT